MTPSPALLDSLQRLRVVGLFLAVVGGIGCLSGWLNVPERFDPAWLTAYFYWLGMALGCLILAMVHGITGGNWGCAIRRVIEAGYQTLPLMGVAFLPIAFGVGRIYEWADFETLRQSEALTRKAGYLNTEGFQLRAIAYFAVWLAIGWVLGRSAPNEKPGADPARSERRQRHSGLCFIAYGTTMTLAAVDWAMSLEPEWYSTMYGLIHIAGQAVSGLSIALVVVVSLGKFEPWSQIVTPVRLNDLGNLLLAAVMFWAYCSFFQFLVIWAGNLPEENIWYVHRSRNGWKYLAIGLAGLHFAVPFLLLLSRHLKRQASDLGRIALLLLVMRYFDLYWLIVPAFERGRTEPSGLTFRWLNLAAMGAIGGAWLAMFSWRLAARVRVPMFDPELTEGVHERFDHAAAS